MNRHTSFSHANTRSGSQRPGHLPRIMTGRFSEVDMSGVEDVLVALRRVIRATDIHSRKLIKTSGLTAPQLLLMQAIARAGEASIGEISKSVSLSQATVTSILDRLEKRQFLYRQRSAQDKRKVHIVLTEEGRAMLAKAPTPLQESFVRQFNALQDWEQAMIVSALQRVAQMMNAGDIDASPFLHLGELDHHVGAGEPPR